MDNQEHAAFEAWWEKHGQFCRAGGGEYEKTFAYRAWQAATPQVAVPAGFVLVPAVPTDDMVIAFCEAWFMKVRCIDDPEMDDAYAAMLAAWPAAPTPATDPVVEANRALLLSRSQVGIAKYGVTLASAGLSKNALIRHALEESLDLSNYLQALLMLPDAEPTPQPAPVLGLAGTPQPAGDAWQPIETAPKDGSQVILTNGVSVAQGWWEHEEPFIREQRDGDGRYIDQQEHDGYDGWLDCDGGMVPDPIHWQPLPGPPIAAIEAERAGEAR